MPTQLEDYQITWLKNKAHFSDKSRSQIIRDLIDEEIKKEALEGGVVIKNGS